MLNCRTRCFTSCWTRRRIIAVINLATSSEWGELLIRFQNCIVLLKSLNSINETFIDISSILSFSLNLFESAYHRNNLTNFFSDHVWYFSLRVKLSFSSFFNLRVMWFNNLTHLVANITCKFYILAFVLFYKCSKLN
jgi:hypothetical protein